MSDEPAATRVVPSEPRPPTPMDRLAAVDAELESLDAVDLAAQVDAFDRMHAALTSALAVTVDQSGRDPGPVGQHGQHGERGQYGQPSLPYEDR